MRTEGGGRLSIARPKLPWLPFWFYVSALVQPLAMLLVVAQFTPTLEDFAFQLKTEVGAYLLAAAALAGAGAGVALHACCSGRRATRTLLGFAVALLALDAVAAALMAPPQVHGLRTLRCLPLPTLVHAVLVAVVLWHAQARTKAARAG